MECVILRPQINAQMAELVDASDSKSDVRKDVQVRFLFWAHKGLLQDRAESFLQELLFDPKNQIIPIPIEYFIKC